MAKFCLEDSEEYYLALSDQPKRFEADSPVTNVFFDDTNGQVFTVRSGGVTGVTVTGMDETKCTSFRMEDRGPIISIKFSPDHKILAIQRNRDLQNATVDFVNFKDLAPTNVEYSHTCKWKNAKILGFVWPRVNEIAFITDHGIELLQVLPEKKLLKNLKSTSFSGAWFTWCPQSCVVLLAGNNGTLLQPFLLNNSTITKLQKLELEAGRPAAERDVALLRLRGAAWAGVWRHAAPAELRLLPLAGGGARALRTGLAGRTALHVVAGLLVVHHQASQTSQVFDVAEAGAALLPVAAPRALRPAPQPYPMYSSNWVVFQPNYIIDARLGCLWTVELLPAGLLHDVEKEQIPRVVGVLARRARCAGALEQALRQLAQGADRWLRELGLAFDEVNSVYRKWMEAEAAGGAAEGEERGALLSQADVCARVLAAQTEAPLLVPVVTAYLASLWRCGLGAQHAAGELAVRALVGRGARGRLRALARRGALGEARPLACQLLSLGHLDPAAAQLALDMLARLRAHEEVAEVLLSWDEPLAALGAARAAGAASALPPRKLLAAARQHAQARARPAAFVAVYHQLRARNERLRGHPDFTRAEQCDSYEEYYKMLTSE